jgi:KRAB domain-containing zinc finger protein
VKAFSGSNSLGKQERIHTGEKLYDFKHGGKAFRYSSLLQIHERIHTGEKTYLFKPCGKALAFPEPFKNMKELIL